MAQAQLEITTEGGTLDLIQGTENVFFVTRQIFDLNNFETRDSDFTQFITVPTTPNNIAILDTAADVTNQSDRIAEKIQCNIKFNGITIAPIAWLIVGGTLATRDAIVFEVIIMYGNFNMIDELSGSSIRDINWADTHTLWEIAEVMAKSSNTFADNDIVFPVTDWSVRNSQSWYFPYNSPRDRTMDINVMGFFLYARTIIERSMQEIGYTLVVGESVPLNFDKIALACPIDKFVDPLIPIPAGAIPTGLVQSAVDQSADGVILQPAFTTIVDLGVYDAPNDQYLVTPGFPSQPAYVYLEGNYTHDRGGGGVPDSTITILHNGSLVDQFSIGRVNVPTPTPFFLSASIFINGGDVIEVELSGGDKAGGNDSTITLVSGASFGLSAQGVLQDRIVRTEEHLPDIKQSTFFANICKLYNLFLVTDDIERTVTLTSFDSIYVNEEVDLSDKLSAGDNAIDISYSLPSLGKSSFFKWGNDDLLRNDFNVFVTFPGALLVESKDVVTMDFSACDNSTKFFNQDFDTFAKAKIPMVEYDKTLGFGMTIDIAADGVFTLSGSGIPTLEIGDFIDVAGDDGFGAQIAELYRVLRVDTADQASATGLLQTPISTVALGLTVYNIYQVGMATFDDRLAILRIDGGESNYRAQQGSLSNTINFNASSVTASWMDSLRMRDVTENQYANILNALTAQQVIRAKFNLTALEVLNFDLRKPVYISTFNGVYYVNKIDQFKISELTTLELIRISIIKESI